MPHGELDRTEAALRGIERRFGAHHPERRVLSGEEPESSTCQAALLMAVAGLVALATICVERVYSPRMPTGPM